MLNRTFSKRHTSLSRIAMAIGSAWLGLFAGQARADEAAEGMQAVAPLLQRYCIDCHSQGQASGGIGIDDLLDKPDLASRFRSWRKIIEAVGLHSMPPEDAEQPDKQQRMQIVSHIQVQLDRHVRQYDGDPGAIGLRRLTSAEYAYTVEDLTGGLRFDFPKTFANDAVGGEGFTNAGSAQFVEETSLERYLEGARRVAEHAVIGAGPIRFFRDPGETGRELSAIDRIAAIYRRYGFRTAAGEGAQPFGLDLYPRALLVAWQFQHRAALGQASVTIDELARQHSLSPRLCQHVWQVMTTSQPRFPLSLFIAQWQSVPEPKPEQLQESLAIARDRCESIAQSLRQWQSVLADAAGDEEEAAVLTAGVRSVTPRQLLKASIDWPDGATTARLELSVEAASPEDASDAIVLWKEPRIRFRLADQRRGFFGPLASHLTDQSRERLKLAQHPKGGSLGAQDFVVTGQQKTTIELKLPKDALSAQLEVSVELDLVHGASRIVRCSLSDGHVEGETAAETGATSTLLADPNDSYVEQWKEGVAQFAQLLPEVSHREPAPSDRDPIPELFDNTYNKPERNHFHTAIKYHRDDRFLADHILDDDAREQLDEAWSDLLLSFDYHTQLLQFVVGKYGTSEEKADSTLLKIELFCARDRSQLSDHLRSRAEPIAAEYAQMQRRMQSAQPGHVQDVATLASAAWRRSLTTYQQADLQQYYDRLRTTEAIDHPTAVRSLITRVLTAPEFLYRIESDPETSSPRVTIAAGPLAKISNRELAVRLSYFLWSSLPDQRLMDLAMHGELDRPDVLTREVERMLQDPKAKRFATEFFGQWLGFYRFDDYRGIDRSRFPELTEELQQAMYEQSISFFEHIIRQNRPVGEILFADYSFLIERLAEHYQLTRSEPAARLASMTRVEGLQAFHRGGLLGLGAIHAVTSAPLRTSAVKRGDWLLRRVIGMPVPPPPADAGSIAADDVHADGLTVRKRLELHRSKAACQNCHSRIDALGFALENFDPLGRWRESYRDGQPIDASGVLNDGTEIRGPEGLAEYLRRQQRHFHRQLAGKLLGYALGRAELASDGPLLEELTQTEGGLAQWIAHIVASRQFQYRRL